jgi:hypothetical protein
VQEYTNDRTTLRKEAAKGGNRGGKAQAFVALMVAFFY